jgi:Rap1a immunity proteins
MHKSLFAAAIFAMVFASPDHPEGSGGALLEICTSTDAISTAACRTYIHGVAETLHIWLDADPETVRACIPASVSEDRLKDVLVRYLKKKQNIDGWSGAMVMVRAWAEEWPCGGPRRR